MKNIILASASPRRKELLAQAGYPFKVVISDAPEITDKVMPDEIVEELSAIKAEAVAARIEEDACIIGADTIVAIAGRILGKPGNEKAAEEMLQSLQGKTHQVYTGVTLIELQDGTKKVTTFSERTDVTMYPMTDEEIRSYIATGDPMDKAGAYGIQGRAAVYIKKIAGDYNNVVGLPIGRLYQEMKKI
ncbi:Maf family protein [uncultured Robinsoniella sp.]|uniref:Maf family protein n=1 Tax=uncultured Robinsoniella sp. TaxID=904190 RepID=UPI00374FD98A